MKKRVISVLAVLLIGGAVFAGVPASAEYELPEDVFSTLGDVNDDGDVNEADLGLLQQYVAEWKLTKFNTANADVNCDGEIDNRDIALLQQYMAGWNVKLGKE